MKQKFYVLRSNTLTEKIPVNKANPQDLEMKESSNVKKTK